MSESDVHRKGQVGEKLLNLIPIICKSYANKTIVVLRA